MNKVKKERNKPLQEEAVEQLQSNQGFTLMEMLLCVLLSCIVISAIGNFMVAAIKQYNHADREINLQIEAQTVVNQLGKMIKEADNVKYGIEGSDSYLIMYYGLEEASSDKVKIAWYHANADTSKPGKMYLFDTTTTASYSLAEALNEIISGTPTKADLMTNYVCGFSVTNGDGTTIGSSGLSADHNTVNVKVQLKNVFKSDEKEYEATDTIKLRNKVVELP